MQSSIKSKATLHLYYIDLVVHSALFSCSTCLKTTLYVSTLHCSRSLHTLKIHSNELLIGFIGAASTLKVVYAANMSTCCMPTV